MDHKPRVASGYDLRDRDRVHATCLYVATKLGDLIDETAIVGGLVSVGRSNVRRESPLIS